MNKVKKGSLIILAAPSGSGKTTIAKQLLNDFANLVFSISATTRKNRENEVEGRDYFFISEDEFKQKIESNEFVEWERFYDTYYGTLKSFINEKLENGISVLFDIDVKGALNIKKQYADQALTLFIMPPSVDELIRRLLARKTESEEDLKKRIDRFEMELTYKNEFDYIIINDDLETAINETKKIVENKINQE